MATSLPPRPEITAQYLLDVLAENIERLRAGQVTPAVANAVVNNTSAVLRITKQQMDYARMRGQTPYLPMLLTSSVEPEPEPDGHEA